MKKIDNIEALFGFPVYVDDGGKIPDEECIIMSKEGWSQVTVSDDFTAVLPLPGPPCKAAKKCPTIMRWNGPKVPSADLDFLCGFMWKFYLERRNELGVHLWHSATDGFWYFLPRQVVSPTATDWDTDLGGLWIKDRAFTDRKPPEDIRRIGCFHSHHVMPPEWSAKDSYFQSSTEYGIQLVVGWLDKGRAVRSRLALFGQVQDVPLDEVVDYGDANIPDVPDWIFAPLVTDSQEKAQKKKAQKEKKRHDRKGPLDTAAEDIKVAVGMPAVFDPLSDDDEEEDDDEWGELRHG